MQEDGCEEKGYELNEYKIRSVACEKVIGLCIMRNRLEAIFPKIKNE